MLTTLSEDELGRLEYELEKQARRSLEAIHIDKFNSDAIKIVVLERAGESRERGFCVGCVGLEVNR